LKIYTENSKSIENSLQIRFTLKPVFNIASVRIGSEAEKAGIIVGDRILKINNQSAYGYTIEKINELLKSEEGKSIELEVERKNKTYNFKFRLKKII
jgi:C-terminal processing protease CtpA/Prc